MLGKTSLLALVLIHTFSANGTEVRATQTAVVLIRFFLDRFFKTVLPVYGDGSFTANEILIRKVDQVSVKQDGLCLFFCLFRGFRINGNGLLIVSSQSNLKFFQ